MSLFSFPEDKVITAFAPYPAKESADEVVKVGRRGPQGAALAADVGIDTDLSSQFVVFQLSNEAQGPSILESSRVDPAIKGSPNDPDILVALELLSFHVGDAEGIDPNTRATMRINFGKDESSTDKRFDAAFWSIAAGLNLYNEAKGQKAEARAVPDQM